MKTLIALATLTATLYFGADSASDQVKQAAEGRMAHMERIIEGK